MRYLGEFLLWLALVIGGDIAIGARPGQITGSLVLVSFVAAGAVYLIDCLLAKRDKDRTHD